MSNSHDDPSGAGHPPASASFADLLDSRLTRRDVLKGVSLLPLIALAPACAVRPEQRDAGIGFTPIAPSTEDKVRVPPEYAATVLYAWGDLVGHADGAPPFRPDAGNTAAEQALQAGMHHDGMHYFPLPYGSSGSERGLLAVNHEYTDDGLLHPDGFAGWSAGKVRKSQNAHGVSVIEVERRGASWAVVRPSTYARRVTGATPIRLSGPAAGHALMKMAADGEGTLALGTLNNCANGHTPWGTYLTCEENWNYYFVNGGAVPPEQKRYGINARGGGYRWHEFDRRFDAAEHPNEPNRFGWVVEIDPYDPRSTPVKRTALGRFKHEGAAAALTADRRLVYYMGDDERFEYIYKFVSRDRYDPRDRTANRDLLDHGTLYVARFDADGTGAWLALAHGTNGLTAERGYASQAEVLIRTRQAADTAGATRMDRPEWIAVHPQTNEVYCTLTNNSARGGKDKPAPDASNPRAANSYGHIVRWREAAGDPAATRFEWDIFVLAGDPAHADPGQRGNVRGDAFGSPDGLWFDPQGRLWIQTDVSAGTLNRGDYANLGNNQMLCADVRSGRVSRFLTGPRGCEVTGIAATPDGRTMFVNMQHPGAADGGQHLAGRCGRRASALGHGRHTPARWRRRRHLTRA